MGSMPVMPHSGEWTLEDLDAAPEHEGQQYELVDGVLLVTPSPVWVHQRALGRLFTVLAGACPLELEVLSAPFDFRPTRKRSLQPDLLVVQRADFSPTKENITAPPELVVEVLSPSTRAKDLVLKRALYAESAVPSYWIIDPDQPSIVVLELEGSEYVERGRAVGDESLSIESPFRVEVTPAHLID
jgi:Uma2 family endonuclease